jgi:hypothetical protein
MEKAEIKLTYGRMGEMYHGTVWVQIFPTRGFMSQLEFEKFSFPRMMSKLAEVIRRYEEVEVVLARTEAPGSRYRLDNETVNLLRTDPAAAISYMMPESRTVMIRNEAYSSQPPSGLLRAGHETLASAFGDCLYCTVSPGGKVECPGCGRWGSTTSKLFTCGNSHCGIQLRGVLTGQTWFVVNVEDVLSLGLIRYYFPRGWNIGRGWIGRDKLSEMYKDFQKERAECSQEIDHKA